MLRDDKFKSSSLFQQFNAAEKNVKEPRREIE